LNKATDETAISKRVSLREVRNFGVKQ